MVNIGKKLSRMSMVTCGVPQGLVLGPILLSVYTNELAAMIKDDNCDSVVYNGKDDLFGRNCQSCGNMMCFADDSSIVTASKRRGLNQVKIDNKLDKISKYLTNNRPTINQTKTKLQESMVRQKRCNLRDKPPTLKVPSMEDRRMTMKTITNQTSCCLLGMNVQNDLSWKAHLESGEKALLPTLRRRLGALHHMGKHIPLKRKTYFSKWSHSK